MIKHYFKEQILKLIISIVLTMTYSYFDYFRLVLPHVAVNVLRQVARSFDYDRLSD